MVKIRTREAILSKSDVPGRMTIAQVVSQGRKSWLLQISAIDGDSARTLVLTQKEWNILRKLVEHK